MEAKNLRNLYHYRQKIPTELLNFEYRELGSRFHSFHLNSHELRAIHVASGS